MDVSKRGKTSGYMTRLPDMSTNIWNIDKECIREDRNIFERGYECINKRRVMYQEIFDFF